MITNDELRTLAERTAGPCVTIYMRTHRAGPDIREDPIRLRDLLDESERRAEEHGLRTEDVRRIIQPARDLCDDQMFWRHQGDGLCLILGENADGDGGTMRVIKLASSPGELVAIGDRINVRPLVRERADGSKFFVVGLSMHRVFVLECFADSYRELDLTDIPKRIEDAVGYDYEQRSLQFHSQTAGNQGARPAQYHGQGRAGGEDRDELQTFLERVENGVEKLLHSDRRAPIVLAGVPELTAKFRKSSGLPNIADETLQGSVDIADLGDLHREALGVLGERFDEPRREAIERVNEALGHDRASVQIPAILEAAEHARIGTLIADCHRAIWGETDGAAGKVTTHDERQPGDEDLIDLAISRALASGAEVFPASEAELPADAPMAGELRF